MFLRGGIVGHQPPPPREARLPVGPGDLLVFTTDGIRAGVTRHVDAALAPDVLADWVLAQGVLGHDDALVMVAGSA